MDDILCQTCKTIFQNGQINDGHGNHCASDVFINEQGQKEVRSHYGSDYDTSRFNLTENSILQEGVVCDECLETEIAAGHAIEDKSFNYFDNIDAVGLEILDSDLYEINELDLDKFKP